MEIDNATGTDVGTGFDAVNAVELATELTIAWLGNPNTRVSADEVPAFMGRMHEAVTALAAANAGENGAEPATPAVETSFEPAVSRRKSLASDDHIVSMIDGKPYKTLKRHLATNGLTPAQYRERYGLPADYPMTARSYSEARRAMAVRIGLGRKPVPEATAASRAPARRRKVAQAA